jgi:D-alanyl-lipoteichoic acid acyltransferase DltB (MBOAT superfamily)
MNFLGLPFLLVLAIGTPVYWVLPSVWRLPTAALAGFLFLVWIAPASAAFCMSLGLFSYALARRPLTLWFAYGAAIAMFLALILLREALSWSEGSYSVLPWLGSAFFSLRTAHYLIACAQGQVPEHRWHDYFCYLFFPPTLLVGPVQRFTEFEREARRCRFDMQRLSAGFERLLFGYAKVVLLADYLFDPKFSEFITTVDPGGMRTYLESLQYGLILYCKFAGYSDVAIGFGLLLGLRLPENFNHPFLARNIGDFWQRWHISVSSWCRDHVSFPLYASTRSAGLSTLVAMLVLGLWHECSARYLLWGAYQGCGILIWQQWSALSNSFGWQKVATLQVFYGLIARFLTFNFVVIGFTITRANNTDEILTAFRHIFRL